MWCLNTSLLLATCNPAASLATDISSGYWLLYEGSMVVWSWCSIFFQVVVVVGGGLFPPAHLVSSQLD